MSSGNVAPKPRNRIPKPTSQQRDKPSRSKMSNKGHVAFETYEGSSPLAEPVYHSSAALGHQLRTLQQLEFDAEGTVLKTLGESEMARINFAEKVAEAVNVSKKEVKYSGLISVSVPVEETLAQEVGDRIARVRTSDKQPWRKPSKASEVPPPDIMKAFTPDLIIEEPKMDVPTLTSQEVKPKPCSPDRTFDLYRHMCSWDS